jgi:hypothetical protein
VSLDEGGGEDEVAGRGGALFRAKAVNEVAERHCTNILFLY